MLHAFVRGEREDQLLNLLAQLSASQSDTSEVLAGYHDLLTMDELLPFTTD